MYYLIWFVAKTAGLALLDDLVIRVVLLTNPKKLPTRTTDKPVRYVTLRVIDMAYLCINAVLEFFFICNLSHMMWHSDKIPKTLDGLTLLNSAGALYLIFFVLDLFYAPAHRFLHWKAVYPYIHKHHHRQIFPARGYLDAGNEHPVEHFIGTSCTWIAILTAIHSIGAHAATIFVFVNIHAALAMLNHSPYDIQFRCLGFHYSVQAHEMHHRCFTTNYAQYYMFWDEVMGTFSPYHAGIKRKSSPPTREGVKKEL
eukprot:CAMPEP_0185769128 /NCGR_PEP_ID=MMETSP1174-20130828/53387_1 /TAXON_ID=35687 /ORGANISM="Dictyocha speculum, Strain CCMP1381" /LENGTH=254 /DNA_ID=CAMNT_0028454087 /DNA_START=74 /DNA_END=838 /DNA_ORIENTATION=+